MEPVPPRAEVTVYSPLFSPFRQPLQGETVSIGRASDCTIPIKDRYLSRKHVELVSAGNEWVLKDLGSANGTYLNGIRVEHDSPLANGDDFAASASCEAGFCASSERAAANAARKSSVSPVLRGFSLTSCSSRGSRSFLPRSECCRT